MLTLKFPDKYQLWTALVHSSADRLFVASDDAIRPGIQVPVEVEVAGDRLGVLVQGTVVGRRSASLRFEQGVFIQISHKELEKFRRYLGLDVTAPQPAARARDLRVHHAFDLRFIDPHHPQTAVTKNVSESLLFVTCPVALDHGQRVRVELALPASPVELQAEVAWFDATQQAAGLHLVDNQEDAIQQLRSAIAAVQKGQQDNELRPILIADDDTDIRMLLTSALSKRGFEVFHARDGDEASRVIRELHPALVVLDILMPGVDGAEICKAMRADPELAEIPVIFVSALTPDVLHGVADSAGATDYLSKPIRLQELFKMVEHYLAQG